MTARQIVHVRFHDLASGQPLPVLAGFTDAAGHSYAPFGRLTDFAKGRGEEVGGHLWWQGRSLAYLEGNVEIALPAGPITVWAERGAHYLPLRQTVVLTPGKMALRLGLRRRWDPRALGWYPGDTQAFFLSPHAALLEARAEDLAVVQLLACYVPAGARPAALPNLLAFSGQQPALQAPGCFVVVGTLNEHAVLGRLALLYCHRVVYPLTFGMPVDTDDWTLADWCDQCHRKGGLVLAADFFRQRRWQQGEVLADLLLGKIDALDLSGWEPAVEPPFREAAEPWYLLLNSGLRLPLVAGSSKDSNCQRLGWPRTYVQLLPGEELTYRSWIEAIRAGRTTLSRRQAAVFLTIADQGPGAVLRLPAQVEKVPVRCTVYGWEEPLPLQLVVDGLVVAEQSRPQAADTQEPVVCEWEIPVPGSGWWAARLGPDLEAHTSPIYIEKEGHPFRPDAQAQAFLARQLEAMLTWVAQQGRFSEPRQQQRLAGIFQQARARLPIP